jgi:HSP20 family molecular chaperone IbpA
MRLLDQLTASKPFSITPSEAMVQAQERIDDVVQRSISENLTHGAVKVSTPEEDAHVYEIDIPGVTRDQISVEVLQKGNRKVVRVTPDPAESESGLTRNGGRHLNFHHVFTLPEDADEVTASLDLGVLSISATKRTEKAPENTTRIDVT